MGQDIKISDLYLNKKVQYLATLADKNGNGVVEVGDENSVFCKKINEAKAMGHEPFDDKEDLATFKEAMGYTQSPETTVAEKVQDAEENVKAEAKNSTAVQSEQPSQFAQSAQEIQAVQPNTSVSRYSQVLTEYKRLREAGKGPYEAYDEVEEKYEDKDEFKSALKELKVKAKQIDAQIETIDAIGQSKATESKLQVKRDAREILEEQDGGEIDKWHKKALNGNNNVVTWISGQVSAMKEVRRGQLYGNRAEVVKENGVSIEDIVKELGEDCPYLQKVTVKDAQGKEKQVTILEAAGLMEERPDGKYNISALSDFVYDNGTGADNSQSRQENKPVREQKLQIAELNAAIKENTKPENNPNLVGYPNGIDLSKTRIKDKYSKRIVRLTDRHVEKKNLLAQAYENTLGGAAAATLGTIGALFFGGKDIFRGVVVNENHLDFELDLDGFSNLQADLSSLANDSDIKKMIEEGTASIIQSGTKINIVVDQKQVQPFIHVAKKHYLANALRSGVIGGALGLLSSALSYGKSEKEVIPNKTDCKSYDEYVTYIDSMVTNKAVKPVYGEIAKLIAVSFIDDNGVFQCAEMNEYLGKRGSNGSRLNRAELMQALIERRTKFDRPEVPPQQQQVVKPKKTYCEDFRTVQGEIKTDEKPVGKTETPEDWGVFASRYQCLEDRPELKGKFSLGKSGNTYKPNNYARTMMKVMQAINDNNYDIKRLIELTEMAISNSKGLKNVQGFDYKLFVDIRGYVDSEGKSHYKFDRQNLPTITEIVNGKLSDVCAPTKPLYQIGKQNDANVDAKKTNYGDKHNKHQEADRDEGRLTTYIDNNVESDTGFVPISQHNENKKKAVTAGYEDCNDEKKKVQGQ